MCNLSTLAGSLFRKDAGSADSALVENILLEVIVTDLSDIVENVSYLRLCDRASKSVFLVVLDDSSMAYF